MIFERFNKLRQNFKGHNFWARGYYISTVGLDEQIIRNYIKNQEAKDLAEEKYVNNTDYSNPF
ncbi:MAG: tnpA [Clostridiales bacterium]|nr:tnpA [Clostridiales bacterium]